MKNELVYYAVYQEHTLGYLFRGERGLYYLGILHANVLRGSTFNWLSGPVLVDLKEIRKATEQDFDDYRVLVPPDFAKLNRNQ